MTVDERDLGVRPEFSGIAALADKIDAEKAGIARELDAQVESARRFLQEGKPLDAARVFEGIADQWLAKGFHGMAESYEQRAREVRAAHRRELRQKRGGRR